MQAQSDFYEDQNPVTSNDRQQLLDEVDSLRRELYSMREQLSGRSEATPPPPPPREPKRESGAFWMNRAQEVTSELDELVRIYEAAAHRPRRGAPKTRLAEAASSEHDDRASMMKKMLLVMLMTEMI